MDRRSFLVTALAGGSALAFEGVAAAAGPVEADTVRTSPTALKIDWRGGAGPGAFFLAATPDAPPRTFRRLLTAPAGSVNITAPTAPRPYILIKTRSGDTWTAERLLPLQGGRNFRDLGGYRTTSGKQVRWGRIYRSGVMNKLTPADLTYLSALGISSICDLRSIDERKSEPAPFPAGGKTQVLATDYEMGASLAGIGRAKTKAEAVTGFADAYLGFLDMLAPQYAQMFARLAKGEGALTLNCSAGKDRTGVGSALILSALGVPRETVVADYALTQVYTPPSVYMQAMSSGGPTPGVSADQAQAMRRMPPEVLQVLMGSDPAVMSETLAKIDAKFGGPVPLLKSKFGVTDADIKRMRGLYLV